MVLSVAQNNLPTDDLLGLCPDKMFLVRRQNAEGELLPCAGLPIYHICALVHVDGALRESGGLQSTKQITQKRWCQVPWPPTVPRPLLQSLALKAPLATHPFMVGQAKLDIFREHPAGFHLLLGEQCSDFHWRRGQDNERTAQ